MIDSFGTGASLPVTGRSPVAPADEVETAYRLHATALERHVIAMTRDAAVAEDVVQESFARLASELTSGRRPDNVRAWLYRVAANLVVTRRRRLTVADRHLPRLVEQAEGDSPESIVLRGETSRALHAALATLPPTDRCAVMLAAKGYRGPEIASLIGRTEGATRTLLCRARSRLRARLVAAGAV